MCDIFALSAGVSHTALPYLPLFAEKGKRNMNGWGIGFYRENKVFVEKSAEQVYSGDHVHESFQRLARVIDSRTILSHISCPLSGGRHSSDNHPFFLPLLDHVWLFVHVGMVAGVEHYRTVYPPRLEPDVYPARIFEFLRDKLSAILAYDPYESLLSALQTAIRSLVAEYPGCYSFFLTNETVLFAFTNFHPLRVLRDSGPQGDVLLLTSVAEGLSEKKWITVQPGESSIGKLLVVTGPDILHEGDV